MADQTTLLFMLVDDNPFNLLTLEKILTINLKGYFKIKFLKAFNGKEAVDMVLENEKK